MPVESSVAFLVVHHAPPGLRCVDGLALGAAKRDLHPCDQDAAFLDRQHARVVQRLNAVLFAVLQAQQPRIPGPAVVGWVRLPELKPATCSCFFADLGARAPVPWFRRRITFEITV